MEVYFLAPFAGDKDGSLGSYYESDDYRRQIDSWFAPLGLSWHWQPVTHATLAEVVGRLQRLRETQELVVFNACDGVDVEGFPGLSVVRALERAAIPFTGAASAFYEITTSKIAMKQRMAARGVATAPFLEITDIERDIPRAAAKIGFPFILKPSVSAGSAGITDRSVVHDEASAIAQARRMQAAPRDLFHYYEGLFAEAFLGGREFTVFLVAGAGGSVQVYPPVERVFDASLPRTRRLLSFDRYWERYEEEEPLPGGGLFYSYADAPAALRAPLEDLSARAFAALDGSGYARVDIREDDGNGALQVLEVNSNCGITSDDQTSVGRILNSNGIAMSAVIRRILDDALSR